MTTEMRPRSDHLETPFRARRSPLEGTTGWGIGLVATWLGFIGYAEWMVAFGPEHPAPGPVTMVLWQVFWLSVWAVTGGLLFRKRWALRGSIALIIPMLVVAGACIAAGVGTHWILEVGFAGAVAAGSLHPHSWLMHDR